MKITMMKKKNDGVSSRRLTDMTTTKEKKKNDDDEDDEESSRPPPPRSSSSSSTDMATARRHLRALFRAEIIPAEFRFFFSFRRNLTETKLFRSKNFDRAEIQDLPELFLRNFVFFSSAEI